MQAKLVSVTADLKRRMHKSIPDLGKWLGAVVRGHVRYFGVPDNGPAITRFRFEIGRLWKRALNRLSQKDKTDWERMKRLIARWLPPARICHPWPNQRLLVTTRGRSPVR